jgi:sugar diacid utilization regulator
MHGHHRETGHHTAGAVGDVVAWTVAVSGHPQRPRPPHASAGVSVRRQLARVPDGDHDGLRTISERIAALREALAHDVEARGRAEAASLQVQGDPSAEEALALSREGIELFVSALRGTESLTAEDVERIRETSARGVHERISLEFLLHFVRLTAQVVWDAVVASARLERAAERDATIEIASRLMRRVDRISRLVTDAYLDEVTDRGLLRRDLLDALISGHGQEEGIQRLARTLHLRLGESYVVVVARGAEMHGEAGQHEPLASRVILDRIVETTRGHVRPAAGSLLAGVRQGDLVALYPVSGPLELSVVREACVELSNALPVDVSLGISAYHHGLRGIATAYTEARAAASIGNLTGIRGRAVGLDDVVVDEMLRGSPHAQRLLERSLQPLEDYDHAHGTQLVGTLHAYTATHFNLTKAAELVSVHPNTVVYRLRRIREISGRDPHDVNDLMVLLLALKARELRPPLTP